MGPSTTYRNGRSRRPVRRPGTGPMTIVCQDLKLKAIELSVADALCVVRERASDYLKAIELSVADALCVVRERGKRLSKGHRTERSRRPVRRPGTGQAATVCQDPNPRAKVMSRTTLLDDARGVGYVPMR